MRSMRHNVIDALINVGDPEHEDLELTLFLLCHTATKCELHELA
jgi:hypothetical protein